MQTDPWKAERAVTPELATKLIKAQFPELNCRSLEPYGEGWDNTVYRVNERYVFRFPRRELAVGLIQIEAAVLPEIPALPLAIPRPDYVGEASEAFPWPFLGYSEILGTTADRAFHAVDEAASHAGRCQAAQALADFLGELHSAPPPEEAPPDEIRRLDLPYRIEQIEERLQKAAALNLIESAKEFDACLEDARALHASGWKPRSDTLVHGDLYARHILVDECLAPCGVIDWGDVHRGDPAEDLAIAHGFLPASAHAAFLKAYGDVDEATWKVARMRALLHALAVSLYAHDVQDAALLSEGLRAFQNLREG